MIKKLKRNKIFNIIFMIFNMAFTILIILLLLVVLVQKFSGNKLNLGGLSIYTVASASMDPVYKVKDLILVKTVDTSTLQIGDDIVYEGREGSVADKIITHRIINITTEQGQKVYYTKGISNELTDPAIHDDQILGKVVNKLCILSFCSHIINNSFGFFFLIFIPFALFLFYELIEITHILKKED